VWQSSSGAPCVSLGKGSAAFPDHVLSEAVQHHRMQRDWAVKRNSAGKLVHQPARRQNQPTDAVDGVAERNSTGKLVHQRARRRNQPTEVYPVSGVVLYENHKH